MFNSYWNSDATLPVASLHRIRRGRGGQDYRMRLRRRVAASYLATSYIQHTGQQFGATMVQELQNLEWVAQAEVIADPCKTIQTRQSRSMDWGEHLRTDERGKA